MALLFALALAPAAQAACTLGKLTELPVTMEGLVPIVPAKVNGVDVRLIADSGAFFSLLTPQAAHRTGLHVGGLPSEYEYIVGLAGMERTGLATAKDFTLAINTFHDADFLVAAPQLGAEDVDGLLGDNILSYADVEFDLAHGVIRLFKPIGCDRQTFLAYWSPNSAGVADILPPERPSFQIVVKVKVNGHDMKAVLDSGAGRSIITRAAARAAGVSVTDTSVQSAGLAGGIGHHDYETWTARFDSFQIGSEIVKDAPLTISETEIGSPDSPADMLLGADFLLSHRLYVANSEHRLYFTYYGGPVFVPEHGIMLPPKGAAPAPPVAPGETPADADGFARRAAAFDARGDFPAAIADLNQLVSMQPTAAHYLQRAIEHRHNGDADAELTDLDATLKLEPANATALIARGVLELQRGDQAAGIADVSAPIKAYIERSGGSANDPRITPLGRLTVTLGWWAFLHRDDANFPEAMNAVCWGHAFWGKELSMGQQRCAIAMDRSPGDGDLHDARGLIDLRFGDDQGAMTEFNGLLDHNPKDAWALFGRGLAELNLGKAMEGHADLAASAALAPGLADVAKAYGITP